jgi:hypothetical protein
MDRLEKEAISLVEIASFYLFVKKLGRRLKNLSLGAVEQFDTPEILH